MYFPLETVMNFSTVCVTTQVIVYPQQHKLSSTNPLCPQAQMFSFIFVFVLFFFGDFPQTKAALSQNPFMVSRPSLHAGAGVLHHGGLR